MAPSHTEWVNNLVVKRVFFSFFQFCSTHCQNVSLWYFRIPIKSISIPRLSKNSQIPLFFKIICVLPLFEKYLAIYHFFKTRVLETQVWHGTWVHTKLDNVELESITMCYSTLVHSSTMWNTGTHTATIVDLSFFFFFLIGFQFCFLFFQVWISLFSFFCQGHVGWEATIVAFFFLHCLNTSKLFYHKELKFLSNSNSKWNFLSSSIFINSSSMSNLSFKKVVDC